jgi:hypothetical protein
MVSDMGISWFSEAREWLSGLVQILERLLQRCAPLADRLDLGGRDFLVDLGIAVLGAQPEAREEFAAPSTPA